MMLSQAKSSCATGTVYMRGIPVDMSEESYSEEEYDLAPDLASTGRSGIESPVFGFAAEKGCGTNGANRRSDSESGASQGSIGKYSYENSGQLGQEGGGYGYAYSHKSPLPPNTTSLCSYDGSCEDDGWESDGGQKAENMYNYFDNTVYVEEAKSVLGAGSQENVRELLQTLEGMFEEHRDPHGLVISFVKRAGKTRPNKLTLPRIALREFKKWLKEKNKNKKKGTSKSNLTNSSSSSFPPSPSPSPSSSSSFSDVTQSLCATRSHQEQVLEILCSCHTMYFDDLCDAYDLKTTAPEHSLVEFICELLDTGMHAEATTYTWKLGLQKHFDLAKMTLPLIAVDKINMIEQYLGSDRELQEQFVMLVDKWAAPGTAYTQIIGRLISNGVKLSETNKFNAKQMFKLGTRMIEMYDLSIKKFPFIFEQRSVNCVLYLLRKRYNEDAISVENVIELLEAVVCNRPSLQRILVVQLVRRGNMEMAAFWADKCCVEQQYLPPSLQVFMATRLKRISKLQLVLSERTPERRCFYQLSLPPNKVLFVDDQQGLNRCRKALAKPGTVIGLDAEWKLPMCNEGVERLALMQLATRENVFLLDMIALPHTVSHHVLREFVQALFQSSNLLILGYQMSSDLHMLAKSWRGVANLVSSPIGLLDLQSFAKEVLGQQNNGTSSKSASNVTTGVLPVHPLIKLLTEEEGKEGEEEEQEAAGAVAGAVGMMGGEEGAGGKRAGGLSLLVKQCFGRPLDKSQQLSDWERRPLRQAQVDYAALDAYCLLDIYDHLKSLQATATASSIDPVPSYI